MKTAKTIVKNSIWLICGEILSKIIVFFFTIIVARKLGVSDFGKYSFALSFVTMIAMFMDFGLSIFLFREISRNRSFISQYVGNILILKLSFCMIFLMAIAFMISVFNYPIETKKIILLLSVWIIFFHIAYIFRTSFKAMERMEYDAVLNVIDNLIRFILVIIFLKLGLGVIGVGYSLLIASLITLCLGIAIFIKRFSKLKFKVDFSIWINAFKQIVPLALVSILITYFGRIDNVIISFFKGDTAVGIYNASLRLVWMLIFIPGYITQATFPKLSEYAFRDVGKFKDLLSFLLKTNFLLTFPITLIIFIFSPFIIKLIYGEEYLLSAKVLRILICTYPFHAMIGAIIYSLNAKNKQSINAFFVGASLLVNVGLDIIVVRKFSYIGVAFATLSSLFMLFFILLFYALKHNYLDLKKLAVSYNDLAIVKKIFFKQSLT